MKFNNWMPVRIWVNNQSKHELSLTQPPKNANSALPCTGGNLVTPLRMAMVWLYSP